MRVLTDVGNSYTHSLIAKGEGYDAFGEHWKMHHTWNQSRKNGDKHETRVLTLHGPKGAKFQMKVVYMEKDGEIVIDRFDPLCE